MIRKLWSYAAWLGELDTRRLSAIDRLNHMQTSTLEIAGGDQMRSKQVSDTDGVKAMRANQEMLYGLHMSDPSRGVAMKIPPPLLPVDKLSQVIVWTLATTCGRALKI